jgi:hypothetical protein
MIVRIIETSVQKGAYDTRALPNDCANYLFLKTLEPEPAITLPSGENFVQNIKEYE